MPKRLTESQVEQYRRDGFTGPVRAIDAEAAADCRRRLEAYEATIGGEAQWKIRWKSHLVFDWMMRLVRNETVLDAVEDLIGPDILVFAASLWTKDAHDPRVVTWHQDSAYFGLDPHESVTVWLAITDATLANGCMRFYPGSHRGPDLEHEETYDPNNLLLRGQRIHGLDDAKGVAGELKAGEFSMHHERTAHSSTANVTDDRRIGYSIFYIPPHVRSVGPRRSALLVRGTDRHGHWDPDPLPRFDLDPVTVAHMERTLSAYRHDSKQAAAES